jgi:hypothetical protein
LPTLAWIPPCIQNESDHSPPSSGEVKNGGPIPPLPQYVFVA